MTRHGHAFATLALAAGAMAQHVEYQRDVRPILAEHCFACHGPDASKRKAELRLDDPASATAARDGRFAIAPGDPERSELLRRITHQDPKERMPPEKAHKPLRAEQIDLLRRWITAGAGYEPHWAYATPRARPLPEVRDLAWCRGYVDRWVLARLEHDGLAPSPEADRATLIRRLGFDLIGLPPSPEEMDAFVADEAPDAYELLVERLIASPHFGERMAMWWLDLVRYADTVGYHGDQEQRIAPYRDWVIAAFNEGMPFDRFTERQLAGDLLAGATLQDRIATGYNRVLQTTHEGGAQAAEYLTIYAADRVRNFGAVWLGATVGCAQCHDHKYDPIAQRDFYALAAFFADVEEKGDFAGSPDTSPTTRPPEIVLATAEEEAEVDRLEAAIAAAQADPGRREVLEKQRAALQARARRTLVTVATEPRVVRLLRRGSWLDPAGEPIEPGVPGFLPALGVAGRRATRLDLAHWLFREGHPLTARVVVNRLWYLLLGKGLSARLDDLGAQGEWPSHPELLDALALDFVASGFSVKDIVRRIVTSSTYRQSAAERPDLRERDPENRLVARQGRWRLQAEMVRDVALAASGLLVREIGGESIRPYQPEGYYHNLNFPTRDYEAHADSRQWRRGVYVHWQRQFLHPQLLAFDAPTREECTAERPSSCTPRAALVLLNDPTFVEAARVLAARVLCEAGDESTRLTRAFRLVLGREPSAAERVALADLLHRHHAEYRGDAAAARALLGVGLTPAPAAHEPAELAAWTSVARALLNLGETIWRG